MISPNSAADRVALTVTDAGVALGLAPMAPPTLPDTAPPDVTLEPRRFPVPGVNVAVPTIANAATTQLFLSCVVRPVPGPVVATPVTVLNVAPNAPTMVYSATLITAFALALRLTVTAVTGRMLCASVDQSSAMEKALT